MSDGIEQAVLAKIEALGVAYERMPIDPAYADTAQFCERYGVPLANSGNTIIVARKKEPRNFAAACVRATRRLDVNRRMKQLLGGGRVSFASADETVALTGMMIGGVTLLALPDGLPIYVDAGLLALDYVILGSGDRSSKLKVDPVLFRRLEGVEILDDLVLPEDGG